VEESGVGVVVGVRVNMKTLGTEAPIIKKKKKKRKKAPVDAPLTPI
jgi:hypothetical protein